MDNVIILIKQLIDLPYFTEILRNSDFPYKIHEIIFTIKGINKSGVVRIKLRVSEISNCSIDSKSQRHVTLTSLDVRNLKINIVTAFSS